MVKGLGSVVSKEDLCCWCGRFYLSKEVLVVGGRGCRCVGWRRFLLFLLEEVCEGERKQRLPFASELAMLPTSGKG